MSLIASDLYDSLSALSRKIIAVSARRLPAPQQESYLEEWTAHSQHTEGKLSRLVHAVGCFAASIRLVRDARCEASELVASTNFYLGANQTTLARPIEFLGRGFHNGTPCKLVVRPAGPNTGIAFAVLELSGRKRNYFCLSPATLRGSDFALVVGGRSSDGKTSHVTSVEHLLAALAGLGVSNAVIEIDGDEIPAFDGSASKFVSAIKDAGLEKQPNARHYIKILKPIRLSDGQTFGELAPFNGGFRIEYEIQFEHSLIGRQVFEANLTPEVFEKELASARTFGFMRDIAKLWGAGYALGASIDNTVCYADDRIIDPSPPRFNDEVVRHKAMDAIGGLAIVGMPIIGRYCCRQGGHKLTAAIVHRLLDDRSAWAIVEAPSIKVD